MSSRVGLLVIGCLLVAASVAVMLWNDLGPGPLDVFIGAVRERTGLPLSVAVWVSVGSMIGVAWILGRRPGVGTLVGPFVTGLMLQWFVDALDGFDAPTGVPVRVAIHVVAIGVIGLGAGVVIVSGLGAGSGELFAGAASDRTGRSEPTVRFVLEMGLLLVGASLGGPVGIGTLVVAGLIGPAVERGYRIADIAVARSAATIDDSHEAIVTRELAAVARENQLVRR